MLTAPLPQHPLPPQALQLLCAVMPHHSGSAALRARSGSGGRIVGRASCGALPPLICTVCRRLISHVRFLFDFLSVVLCISC
jgi:hypothetical protein